MNKKDFRKTLTERILIMDGATGTELQKRGCLDGIDAPEELNLKAPGRIREIHDDYLKAGADVILANTFGANRRKLSEFGLADRLEEINRAGVAVARAAAENYGAFVAADIGPLGAYCVPLGPLSFDAAYDLFAEQVRALGKEEPDVLVIETMAEIRETKAALLAARDNFSGPVFVQMTFSADGTTVTGTDLLAFLAVTEAMGADGVGMNCSVGPGALADLAARLAPYTRLPISFKPNAGMPKLINRQTVFPGTVEEFLAAAKKAHRAGVNLLGGCCGTTPEFIQALAKALKGKKPAKRASRPALFLASRTKALNLAAPADEPDNKFNGLVTVIGERINPTNRKKFQEELLAGNLATLRREAKDQAEAGARLLDLNLGLPGADEKALMARAVEEIQEVVSAPLCLDSSSAAALEAGIKACAGKPLLNSVNGDDERLKILLPLARRYGAMIVGLATDERGLPKTAAERLVIAERILVNAKQHGIPSSEVVIDYLTLSASAMADQARETLTAIRESKKRWPDVRTVLGISNISFGLPERQALNSSFLKLARQAGLDLAILNPFEDWSIDDKSARELLLGKDPGGKKYIARHAGAPKKTEPRGRAAKPADARLFDAVVEGNREEVGRDVEEVLGSGRTPLSVANDILLKALNEVGERFNRKEFFLPQVIRAAEAAQGAFAKIKPLLKKEGAAANAKIVLATVKGDVHDIGKNIVAAVLESHGWEVVDLGKNVGADAIVEAAKKEKAPLIGLSALMTTTMLEMEKVVRAREAAGIPARIIIGGAPVTERFAREIGADGYAKDAVEAARLARALTKKP
ncbi:MAG: homocysteine S-methyltransferase family protein [Endomicrobiales bacterium]